MNTFLMNGFFDEMTKLAAKAKKVEPTWEMKHPVGAGAAYMGGQMLLPQISPPTAGPLALAAMIGTMVRTGQIAKKYKEATGKELEKAPSWWVRHPYAGSFLLGPIGLGLTAAKTRTVLARKKLLKKERT